MKKLALVALLLVACLAPAQDDLTTRLQTLHLGRASATSGGFWLWSSSHAFGWAAFAPTSMSANRLFYLPGTYGSAGDCLKTDGAVPGGGFLAELSFAPCGLAALPFESVTTTKTTTAGESGEAYNNTGDTDGATITLMNDPTIGLTYRFFGTVAQTLTIVPSAGETLMLGTSTCGTSITLAAIGANVTITASTGGAGAIWAGIGANATCNP